MITEKKEMKLSLSLFALARADECGDCDNHIANFNDWHGNPSVTCSRYVDPKDSLSARGACKACKVACIPSEEACPTVSEYAHVQWNKTAKKLTAQYLEKYEKHLIEKQAENTARKVARNLDQEQAKYNKIKQKMEEKAEKAANKQAKYDNYQAWREEKRAENEAARAQRKQEKKERKAAAKAAKELRREQRLQKRALAAENKAKFSFYASLEFYYHDVCPDLHLIDAIENVNARMMSQYEKVKEEFVEAQNL